MRTRCLFRLRILLPVLCLAGACVPQHPPVSLPPGYSGVSASDVVRYQLYRLGEDLASVFRGDGDALLALRERIDVARTGIRVMEEEGRFFADGAGQEFIGVLDRIEEDLAERRIGPVESETELLDIAAPTLTAVYLLIPTFEKSFRYAFFLGHDVTSDLDACLGAEDETRVLDPGRAGFSFSDPGVGIGWDPLRVCWLAVPQVPQFESYQLLREREGRAHDSR